MNGPLLRGPVLRLTEAGWFRRLVTGRLGRPVVARFVAGEHLDDAVRAAKALDGQKISTILDHLGENVTAPEHAVEAVGAYVRALDRIRVEPFLDLTVSVKLTQLGLDFSHELCVANMERVLEAAAEIGTLVMIDMESSAYVDRTLRVFRELRERHDRVGVALQTCLRRTGRDVDELPDGSVIRIVKGAYLEPPEVAFATRREVDTTFAQLTATLLARGHVVHVATHDPALLDGTVSFVERRAIPWTRVEFQMLYGIRRDLQNRLANEGYPVRVYVPYGTEWYPYLTRRMAERPANMWFFASNLVRFGR
ncbi:MAG TPA: proline dehydrogenase family protein [Actinomycetota bacterium]|nr:proline dehydrogenase family protein [Actinomycetota bacterium]